MGVIKGAQARTLLAAQIQQHADGIFTALAAFEAETTAHVWMATLQGVEEFINLLMFGLQDYPLVEEVLASLPLDSTVLDSRRVRFAFHYVEYIYGSDFADRLKLLLLQAAIARGFLDSVGMASAANGLSVGATLVGYLQSRRRHLVALLHTIPIACKGTLKLGPKTALRFMLPIVEYSGTTLTGLVQNLALVELHADFTLITSSGGFAASHSYPALGPTFLEPERLPITDAAKNVPASAVTVSVPKDKLFSVAELRRDIQLVELAYEEFELGGKGFGPMAAFIVALGSLATDDFTIVLSQTDFDALADAHGLSDALRKKLMFGGATYLDALNTFAPFVCVGSQLRTSVTLLSRFLYNWKNVCLYRSKRFQIRSGFEFEKHVRQQLEAQGFELTDIKRLKRKEFDVVAIRDGIVFNVQCKNNLVDPEWVDTDPTRFVKVNISLARSYEKALQKERGREGLLKEALALSRIEPFVVSRFPVVCDNPRIISGTLLHRFGELASTALGI